MNLRATHTDDASEHVSTAVLDAAIRPRYFLTFLRDILIIIVIALLVSWFVKTYVVRSFFIPSGSMQNTLQVHDRILVNEIAINRSTLNRGDIVVFQDPGGWLDGAPGTEPTLIEQALEVAGLTASDSGNHLIKRIIGLPGDHVVCCNDLGQIAVNGTPLDEPYIREPDRPSSSQPFDVEVPEDSLWVMGDNRNSSSDSRANVSSPGKGFVPIQDVVGKAFLVVWPIAHIRLIG
ncbi:signal peptidase I [Microbacterium phyllosphaerae]|uniref:signal peptidase I n=1 Tax=Microbacterium phyllosphaerae TaxID=124798 RepID=UPI003D65D4AE